MSDLSMYELEDIIWDEFDRGDDHIVPHPTNARTSRNSTDASHTVYQEKEEKDSKLLDNKKKMMEKESPSQAQHGVFNDSCDGEIVKDMPNLPSDDIRMPVDSCFKSSYATSAIDDNNSYSYPLTQISQPGELCFVDNNCENKESGDLLYYSWPDIGNFEDVDKMLRSCDSSFGLGVTDNDDELGWFTSDQTEATGEALNMDFRFPCPEPSGLKNILNPDHGSTESSNHRSSCISGNKDEHSFKDLINLQKKQSKHHAQPVDNHHQYKNLELDYFGHLQHLPPVYTHQTTPVPVVSGIKSEYRGLKSPSPMGSSYASNQSSDEQNHSQRFQPVFVGSPRQMGMVYQPSKDVLISHEQQGNLPHKSRKDIEGDQKVGLLNVQEGSSVSSGLDEISLEATSFRQLRQVMEQLDLRTKLCIRDSLYRLARSAEQRHNNPSLSSGATDVNDLGGPSMSERTSKCTGFMDMETDTNPIDRSVAHLLFHRPSESVKLPAPLPPKPNQIHGSIPGQSIAAEKLVGEEEAAGGLNDRICGN